MSELVILSWQEAPEAERESWLLEAKQRMPDVHANRQKEWALARVCLAQCFALHGIKLTPNQYVSKGHHELVHSPAWRFSLSHTKDQAAAWLMPTAQVRGLGLDIEEASRSVPAQIKARLSHPNDMQLAPLELWALKEAAYKALPSLAQDGIWLNRIKIEEQRFSLEDSPFQGRWKLRREKNLLIALAFLPTST